ncbi:hypothetical protein BH23ACT9_BH23ACT9_25280 [soil metagenome]
MTAQQQRGRRAWPVFCISIACALAVIPTVTAGAQAAGAQAAGHVDLPAEMPGDRLLLSHRSPTSDQEVHTVDQQGGERMVLTEGHADFGAVWSPDGRHVAFHRVEAAGDGLWVVGAEGGPARRLADGGHRPAWSPDSTRIIHSPSTETELMPLAITDLTGTTTHVPGSTGGINPAWSPDGNQIAYTDPGRDLALVISHIDGSDRTVTPGPATDPAWSPATDRVAYINRRDQRSELRLIDGAASEEFKLTDRFAHIQQLAYSPTGTHVAFAAAEEDDDQLDVWTIRIADGHLQQLTNDPAGALSPTWSASAELIAFTRVTDLSAADSPRDVFVVPSAGGPVRQVTSTGDDHAVAFAPGLTLRLAERDRIGTAIALSRTFDQAATVVLARAEDYPDALAAAPLAAAVGGPILLTGGDALDPSLAPELRRLGTTAVYLAGGSAALAEQVEQDLADIGITDVERLHGTERFATAARILDELDVLGAAFQRIFVVEGENSDPARGWPDALSASGVAARTLEPVLLVTRDRVPAETASALHVHSDARVTVVGGTASVGEAVEQQIADVVAGVDRLAGANRYETSVLAADLAVAHGASAAHPWLVTGRDWPDALVAAPAVARDGGVLLLVDGGDPVGSAATHAWLTGHAVRRGVIVGGTAAVAPTVRAAIESSLTSAPQPS